MRIQIQSLPVATIRFARRIWSPTMIAFGLFLTLIWAYLLGYGFFAVVEHLI